MNQIIKDSVITSLVWSVNQIEELLKLANDPMGLKMMVVNHGSELSAHIQTSIYLLPALKEVSPDDYDFYNSMITDIAKLSIGWFKLSELNDFPGYDWQGKAVKKQTIKE